MEERDEALDFIYKGWRDGRQQRRNVMNQRGSDRIAARRAMMERIGSSQLPRQRRSPPPQRNEVASTPPSSTPEQTSSTSVGNFTDDIATPDDESTPQNEAAPAPVQDTVSSPPIRDNSPVPLETAMANLDVAMGGTGATRSTYDPTKPKPTQANVQASPDEAFSRPAEQPVEQPVEQQKPNLSESFDILEGKVPYNVYGERVPEPPKPKGMKETPYKAPYQRPKDSRTNISEYGEPPKRPYEKPEMPFMKPSVEGYKKTPITRLKPDGGSGEAVPEKTATLTPVKRLKPVEQQHKESFETAYDQMMSDENRAISGAINQGINEGYSEANKLARTYGREDEATQAEIPDEIDFKQPSEPSKEERAEEMFNRVQNRKSERLGEKPEYETDDSKLTEKDKKAMAAFEKVQERKKKRKAKAKETPKPDKKVSQAAKETIKPAKQKATEKGKANVKGRADSLAAFGMGFNDDQPKE